MNRIEKGFVIDRIILRKEEFGVSACAEVSETDTENLATMILPCVIQQHDWNENPKDYTICEFSHEVGSIWIVVAKNIIYNPFMEYNIPRSR